VAELTIAEAILLMRRIPEKNFECHRGGWSSPPTASYEVRGKVMGIVGYGHIGTQVGVLAESLGMRVLYYDIETKLALGNATPASSMGELLAAADVVTLHVPELAQTRDLNRRRGTCTDEEGRHPAETLSRGNVVVIEALAEALP